MTTGARPTDGKSALGSAASLLPLALLLVTIGFLVLAHRYGPVARAMPLLVGWIMLVLVAVDLVSRTRTKLGAQLLRAFNPAAMTEPSADGPAPLGPQLAVIGLITAFVAGLALIGVLGAVPLFVFASLRLRARRGLLVSLVTAAATTLFVWLMFAIVLQLPLFAGLLFGGDW